MIFSEYRNKMQLKRIEIDFEFSLKMRITVIYFSKQKKGKTLLKSSVRKKIQ